MAAVFFMVPNTLLVPSRPPQLGVMPDSESHAECVN